ncbi:MAG TPA: hypothetical protein VKT22_06695 [Steroidobacteraceae bacterium]|nr:hypothetical protein [Steroidobacteraceae bacterium]
MKSARARCLLASVLAWSAVTASSSQPATPAAAPLELVQTIEIPKVPSGPYADHLAIDRRGHRLFSTPQAAHAVAVLDLDTGHIAHWLRGIGNPHAVFYLEDRRRLFVTDGAGAVLVFDGDSYRPLRRIGLAANADGLAYDEQTGLLYVTSGGEDAGLAESQVNLIDTVHESMVGEIALKTPALEAMVIDPARRRLYVNAPDENAIFVIDLARRAVSARWPLTLARRNEAFALDAARERLYVGCNEGDVRGALIVIDTATGRELERLPLGSWVDSMFTDEKRGRIYASTGIGSVFSYEHGADGRLRLLPTVDTAVMARTSLFDSELDRLFVLVPHLGWTSAKVLVFKPR